ncbi:MAG: type IV pilus secretin PilQ [Candidatus Tectomicrobia bacterium]|uniref:Type IV pilus secretin PilQ n=1 Tax=Tectimicrobiota bacterium TaxID=2528274 RepID=A0A932G014_UNCTE|nr:type IV pilus secretin PilQ [Candidatus Tectomicrobia bacterium]
MRNRRRERRDGRHGLLVTLLTWGLLVGWEEIAAASQRTREAGLKERAAAQGIPYPPPAGKILIDKASRTLIFYAGEVSLKEYPIALGTQPVGAKLYEGDGRTPEGTYQVVKKTRHRQGRHRLQIDYPNPADRQRYQEALKEGKIPQDRDGSPKGMGGEISLYGGGVGKDWTTGGIAMREADLEELFEVLSPGTPVVILPQRSVEEAQRPKQETAPGDGREKAQRSEPEVTDPGPKPESQGAQLEIAPGAKIEAPGAQPEPASPLPALPPGPSPPAPGKAPESGEPQKVAEGGETSRKTGTLPGLILPPAPAAPSGAGSPSITAGKPGNAFPFPDSRCSLDLREANIREVLQAFAQEYRLNLLLEEGAEGKLTLQFHNLPVKEAFLAILNANGLSYLYDGKVFRVGRLEALSKRREEERKMEGLEVQVIPLQHTSAEGLAEVIKGLKSDQAGAQVIADKRTNALLLKDLPANLVQMQTAIERLDVKKVTEIERFQTKILRLKYLTVGGSRLDQGTSGSGSRKGRGGGGGGRGGGGSKGAQGKPASPMGGAIPTRSSIEDSLEGLRSPNGRISIDEHNNALIVTDLPENISRIEAILQELDVPARQILIEARIVEATRDFQKRLGVLWSGAFSTQGTGNKTTVPVQGGRSRGDDSRGVGERTVGLATPLGTIGVDPLSGIALGRITNRMTLDMELNAMEKTGQGRILSTPRVTTLDNKEAIIESGLSIPYQKREELGTITIEFADALISLAVIPHVTPDDHILLNILATKDEADFVRQVQGVPTIITRHASTKVLVKDGETTVIGGLSKRDTNTNAAQVPWLGKLPLVGALFRDHSQKDSSEELLIFITPKIIENQEGPGARSLN